MMKLNIGDIVEVITPAWATYGLTGRIAIVSPPKDRDCIYAFELICKPTEWHYDYFQLGREGMQDAHKYLRVLGHV